MALLSGSVGGSSGSSSSSQIPFLGGLLLNKRVPPTTRFLCILLGCMYLWGAVQRMTAVPEPTLLALETSVDGTVAEVAVATTSTMTPAMVLPGHWTSLPWTAALCGFYETSLLALLAHLLVLLPCGRYLEHVWSSRELLQFMVITQFFTSLVVAGILLSFSLFLSGPGFVVYGMTGMLGGLCIVYKQLIPEHTVHFAKGLISIRVKHLPLLFNSLNSLVFVLGLDPRLERFLQGYVGLMVTWVYLRFFQMQNGIRGDHSEEFALVSFFPELVRPVVRPMANATHAFFTKMGWLGSSVTIIDLSMGRRRSALLGQGEVSPSGTSAGNAAVGKGVFDGAMQAADAERRRAIALKALEERMLEKQHQEELKQQQGEQKEEKQADAVVVVVENLNAKKQVMDEVSTGVAVLNGVAVGSEE